jgi:hypothetical protein
MTSTPSLLDKARQLASRSALVIAPLATVAPAQAATPLEPGYSFVGEHSSSGWFMSEASFNDLAAGAAANGTGVTLSAAHSVTDGMFWSWSDHAQTTLRRYDVTGIAFAWGGNLGGAAFEDDLLEAAFAFTIDFTNTPLNPNDSASVQWSLYIGTRAEPYTPQGHQRGPQGWSGSSVLSGSFDTPGAHTVTGQVQRHVQADEAGASAQWYAMLVVDWRDTWYSRPGWDTASNTANGDILSVTTVAGAPTTLSLTPVNLQAGQVFENGGSYTVASSGPTYRVHGTLRNLAGATFAFGRAMEVSETGVVDNAGLFSGLFGAGLRNHGRFTNVAGGTFEMASGSLHNAFSGLFGNAGTMTIGSGAGVENEGRFENRFGGLFGGAGGFQNRADAVVDNAAGAIWNNSGTVSNAFRGLFGNAGTLHNTGTLETAGVFENSGALGNAGLMGVLGGGAFHNLRGGTVTNTGTLTTLFGGLFGNLGTFTNAAGATVQNDGTFQNLASGLFGGLVHNHGSFVNTSANTLDNAATFHNHGELYNGLDGRIVNSGTLTNHAGATLDNWGRFENTGTLANAGTLHVRRMAAEWDGTTYVFGDVLRNDGSIVNTGSVAIEATSAIEGNGSFVQTAGLTTVDGVLAAGTLSFAGGRVEGSGTLAAALVQNLGATIAPGGAGAAATLTIDGNLLHASGGTLELDILGTGGSDLLSVLGSTELDGALVLNIGVGVAAGTRYTLLTSSQGISGQFSQVSSAWGDVSVVYGADAVSLTLISAVPEPGTWLSFGGGLVGLAWTLHRRRRAERAPGLRL